MPKHRSVLSFAGIAVVVFAVWLGWPRIVGIPAWLRSIGFLGWLSGLAPLEQWFIAFGTVSAVVYAIFHEMFLSWLRRPKLRVLYEPKQPFIIQIPVLRPLGSDRTTVFSNPSFQVRMIVQNEGTTRAEAVSIYARRLYRRTDGRPLPLDWFLPMDLKWTEDEKAPTAISAGVERTCNVVGVEKPSQLIVPGLPVPQAPPGFDYQTACFAHIQTIRDPSSSCNIVFPGAYRLELVLSAANAKSQLLYFDFWFDGRWFDAQRDMIPEAASFFVTTGSVSV